MFLFGKEHVATAYDDAAGVRLLVIVAVLESIRLAAGRVPTWLAAPVYLLAALLAVRRFAGIPWRQVGFNRWADWNTAERSYFVQVIVIVNVVFPLFFAAQLRPVLTNPAAVATVFFPYLVYGFYQEVLYRGMLQTEFVRRWGAIAGVLVANVLYTFGPQHYRYFFSRASLAIPMFASIFAMGLIFALVFHRTRNLWIPAVMHAFGNAYIIASFGRLA